MWRVLVMAVAVAVLCAGCLELIGGLIDSAYVPANIRKDFAVPRWRHDAGPATSAGLTTSPDLGAAEEPAAMKVPYQHEPFCGR